MSFFKRAVISALTRREERREENIEEFDNDVKRGLKILEQASARKKDSDEIIRNRKKIIRPLQISAETSLGYRPSMEATIYAHQLSGKNPEKTNQILKGLSRTTAAGKDMAEEMPSTTEPLTGPQQMSQAFAKSTEQTIRTEGETPETMGSRVASTVLGTLLGRAPNRSVSETVRQKYIDTFENKEQGENVYNELMNYRNQRSSDGDPAEMPDLDPSDVKLLQAENNKLGIEERIDASRLPVRSELEKNLRLELKQIGMPKLPGIEAFVKDGVKTISSKDIAKIAAANDIKKEQVLVQARQIFNDYKIYAREVSEVVSDLYKTTGYTRNAQSAYEKARDIVQGRLKNNIFTGTTGTTSIKPKTSQGGEGGNSTITMNSVTPSGQIKGGRKISLEQFKNMYSVKDETQLKEIIRKSNNREFPTNDGRIKVEWEDGNWQPYLFVDIK